MPCPWNFSWCSLKAAHAVLNYNMKILKNNYHNRHCHSTIRGTKVFSCIVLIRDTKNTDFYRSPKFTETSSKYNLFQRDNPAYKKFIYFLIFWNFILIIWKDCLYMSKTKCLPWVSFQLHTICTTTPKLENQSKTYT